MKDFTGTDFCLSKLYGLPSSFFFNLSYFCCSSCLNHWSWNNEEGIVLICSCYHSRPTVKWIVKMCSIKSVFCSFLFFKIDFHCIMKNKFQTSKSKRLKLHFVHREMLTGRLNNCLCICVECSVGKVSLTFWLRNLCSGAIEMKCSFGNSKINISFLK